MAPNAAPTTAPVVPVQNQNAAQKPLSQQAEAQPPLSDAPSGMPIAPNQKFLSKEEKVEFRDQDGNLLDPEAVKALEGKVSFKTRYETRTRLLDANGNELPGQGDDVPSAVPVAPPHPDVDNVDPETADVEKNVKEAPALQHDVSADESKEQSLENSSTGEAKPASEGNEATAA